MCAVKGKHRVCIRKPSPRICSVDIPLERPGPSWLSFKVALGVFQDECHNFIKVLVPRNDDLVFICGTNGFNPMCRYYRVSIQCHRNAMSCEAFILYSS